jgi:isopentenyl-diphosphate Delta-isomerase
VQKINDQVILVDEQDNPIGVMDKIEAHRGEGRLHRAASVFLFNDVGQTLIQQRSSQKIVGALQWANTCCGNVWPNEEYEACAQRRLDFELGITDVTLTPLTKFRYQTKCNEEFSENEMDTVFTGNYSGEIHPNPDEVKDFRWIDWTEFKQRVANAGANDEFIIAPWTKIMMELEAVSNIAQA